MKIIPIRPAQLAALLAGLLVSRKSIAAPGDLDLTFGGTGKVTTAIAIGTLGDIGTGGTRSGSTDFALARYNANGSLDPTFNGTGIVTTAIGSGNDSAAVGGTIVRCLRFEIPVRRI